MDEWFAAFVWFCAPTLCLCECVHSRTFAWDMMQTERAVSLLCFDVSSRKKKKKKRRRAESRSKTHFLCRFPPIAFTRSCSNGSRWHQVQRFIFPKQIHLMKTTWDCLLLPKLTASWCKKKKKKNPQADLIPYLHLKDHSAFKLELMIHSVIFYIIKVCSEGEKYNFFRSEFFGGAAEKKMISFTVLHFKSLGTPMNQFSSSNGDLHCTLLWSGSVGDMKSYEMLTKAAVVSEAHKD